MHRVLLRWVNLIKDEKVPTSYFSIPRSLKNTFNILKAKYWRISKIYFFNNIKSIKERGRDNRTVHATSFMQDVRKVHIYSSNIIHQYYLASFLHNSYEHGCTCPIGAQMHKYHCLKMWHPINCFETIYCGQLHGLPAEN